jgi:hypothetical protein
VGDEGLGMNRKMIVAVGLSALLCLSACGSTKKEADQVSASAEKAAEPASDTSAPASTDTTAAPTTSTTATPTTAAPSTGPADATDAAFIAQGNALCAKFNDQADSVAQPTDTTPEAIGAYLDGLLTLYRQQVGQMKALTPSPTLAGQWAGILTTLDAEGAKIESAVTRLKAGDTSAMNDLSPSSTDDINAQFDAIGMTTCGSASD